MIESAQIARTQRRGMNIFYDIKLKKMRKGNVRKILKLGEFDINIANPYIRKCKYNLCGEWFAAERSNEDYCCDLHRNRQKVAVLKERNLVSNRWNRLTRLNYEILKRLYMAGVREISESALMKYGFSRLALFLRIEDAKRGGFTKIYYDYGIRLIGEDLYRIVSVKGALLDTH